MIRFRRRPSLKRIAACSSPEELGEILWRHTGSDLPSEEFDAALKKACALSSFHHARLRYPWTALVALAPDVARLDACLSTAPAGFEPLFSPALDGSTQPSGVFGGAQAWRTALVLSHRFRTLIESTPASAGVTRDWVQAVGSSSLAHLRVVVPTDASLGVLCDALAEALELSAPSMGWVEFCDLVGVWSHNPASDVTWLGALTEELAALNQPGVLVSSVRAACVQAWRSLIDDPSALERAKRLRSAGAAGSIGELMLVAEVVSL